MKGFFEFISNNTMYLLIVLAVFVVAYIASKIHAKTKQKEREKKSSSYILGLNEFIAGNYTKAKEHFIEAVRFNTNNIDAYLKLGTLFLKENKPSQALKIHKELTVRAGISNTMMADIFRNIVEDLIELKNYNEALTYIDKILSMDSINIWALEMQPKIYALKKDWKNAFKYMKSNSEDNDKDSRQLALYKIANGLQLLEIKEYHDARLLFKEAIKFDKLYPPPYLLLGEAYARQERIEDAVSIWREFAEAVPEKSYLVFGFLEKAYYESSNYGAMEVFYSKIIEKDPDNYRALLNLGEIFFKKGDQEKAFDMTERSLKVNPQSSQGLRNLIMYLNNAEDVKIIKEKALSLAETVSDQNPLICTNCGYEGESIQIICPNCDMWDTFKY